MDAFGTYGPLVRILMLVVLFGAVGLVCWVGARYPIDNKHHH